MATRRVTKSRAPFPASIPRASKRVAGVTDTASTPLSIRLSGLTVEPDVRAYVRDRLGTKLGKFATSIERSTVRLRDDNGPRGGVDVVCTIKIVLRGLDSVVYEATGAEVREAFDGAAGGVVRAVKRALGRAGRSAPKTSARAAAPAPRRRATKAAAPVADADAGERRPAPRATGKSATQLARREVRATRSPKTRAQNAVVERRGKGKGGA